MPLCTLHLLALHPTTPNPLSTFLSTLASSNVKPLVVSRVIRWIILPTHLSIEHLLARNIQWHVFLILPSTDRLPSNLEKLVQHHWTITAGVPSRLLQNFHVKNAELLNPDPASVPPLTSDDGEKKTEMAKSSQDLELSDDLDAWIQQFTRDGGKEGSGAVSMFNLLAFNEGMKEEYLKYGAAFADSIGSRHGGNAKIVGNVVAPTSPTPNGEGIVDASKDGWHEIALAHYPSIKHFADMLRSEDYQEVNRRYRVGSLRDTAILMTNEVGIGGMMGGGVGGGAKL